MEPSHRGSCFRRRRADETAIALPRCAEVAARGRRPQGPGSSCSSTARFARARPGRRRVVWDARPLEATPETHGEKEQWADVALWVREAADNHGSELWIPAVCLPPPDSWGASLVLGAFKKWRPGTRRFSLKGKEFYAFTAPHEHTRHVCVFRRLGDVVQSGYGSPDPNADLRIHLYDGKFNLTPGKRGQRVGPLADMYQKRPYEKAAWLYWESFWAPEGPLACAAPTDAAGSVFTPQLRPEEKAVKFLPGRRFGAQPGQAAPTVTTGTNKTKAEAFTAIYKENTWPGVVSKSGPGSDPFHPMVRIALSALHIAVDSFGVRSILDAACGDAGWMTTHFLSKRPEVSYTGVDIVAHVVEDNRQRYPHLQFIHADLGNPNAENEPPLPCVDLVFSKETLNHMFVRDACHALQRLQASGSKYLLANITRGAPNNMGATKGHHANYAQYDYSQPPYNLRKLERLMECNRDDWTEYALFALQSPPLQGIEINQDSKVMEYSNFAASALTAGQGADSLQAGQGQQRGLSVEPLF